MTWPDLRPAHWLLSLSKQSKQTTWLNHYPRFLDANTLRDTIPTMTVDATHLVWIDLEMTGLDTVHDHIIEIATVITDSQLQVLAEGPVLAIHQPNAIMAGMDKWNTEQHATSGLTQRVQTSTCTTQEAEQATLHFLRAWVPEQASPMCGNSICQDRRFLARQMPTLERYFHYRHLDVSTLKELAQRWAPQVAAGVQKTSAHLALSDIHDSIAELAYYRQHLMRY